MLYTAYGCRSSFGIQGLQPPLGTTSERVPASASLLVLSVARALGARYLDRPQVHHERGRQLHATAGAFTRRQGPLVGLGEPGPDIGFGEFLPGPHMLGNLVMGRRVTLVR